MNKIDCVRMYAIKKDMFLENLDCLCGTLEKLEVTATARIVHMDMYILKESGEKELYTYSVVITPTCCEKITWRIFRGLSRVDTAECAGLNIGAARICDWDIGNCDICGAVAICLEDKTNPENNIYLVFRNSNPNYVHRVFVKKDGKTVAKTVV